MQKRQSCTTALFENYYPTPVHRLVEFEHSIVSRLRVSVKSYLSVHQPHLFHKFIKRHTILEPLLDKL